MKCLIPVHRCGGDLARPVVELVLAGHVAEEQVSDLAERGVFGQLPDGDACAPEDPFADVGDRAAVVRGVEKPGS